MDADGAAVGGREERQGGVSDIWTTTAVAAGSATEGGPASGAVGLRANVMEMTQTAEDAVLAPADPGAWSHDLRAALAVRIARLNAGPDVADRYAARMQGDEFAALTDPSETGQALGLSHVVTFMDKVAAKPRDIAAEDISVLQTAGVADADIVRLCELNAFLAYQLRLIAGLKLMTGTSGGAA